MKKILAFFAILIGLTPLVLILMLFFMGKIDAILYIRKLPVVIHYYIFISLLITSLYFTFEGIRLLFKSTKKDNSYPSESGGTIGH